MWMYGSASNVVSLSYCDLCLGLFYVICMVFVLYMSNFQVIEVGGWIGYECELVDDWRNRAESWELNHLTTLDVGFYSSQWRIITYCSLSFVGLALFLSALRTICTFSSLLINYILLYLFISRLIQIKCYYHNNNNM
jgi:hypothetical protein